ncbi:hypothetical protein [Spirosoma sp.]|uniref:hypothetical protein n=1 Tax=Spirosoma sp. TaxID=1899569 RepID=UPI00261D7635|nr:hypothetical protein [Spirosoma sp.]MCX6217623.1 hypothetical protein [Spirosoma sp.]
MSAQIEVLKASALPQITTDLQAAVAASATTATNKATEAGNSATAANTSAVAASASAAAAAAASINTASTLGSVATAVNLDFGTGGNVVATLTLTANTTPTFLNGSQGRTMMLVVTQGGAGGFSLTLPAACKVPGGAVLDWNTTPGAVNIICLTYINSSYIITTNLKM